ncbi:MAG: hypothetical protein AABW93_02575 [Nanoarchaeota archaeon]
MPEISEEEARGRLEDTVKDVNWITHFLGNETKQRDFLEVYRGLHAQLHEGDRLEIELGLYSYPARDALEIPTAGFKIVLHSKDGKKERVYSRDATGGIGLGNLLYRS